MNRKLGALLIFFLAVFLAPGVRADFCYASECTPDADTYALYHFEEGSGSDVIDSSAAGNDATVAAVTWNSTDKKFGSYALDLGDNTAGYASITNTSVFGSIANGTLEFWVYLRDITALSYIFDSRGGSDGFIVIVREIGHANAGKLEINLWGGRSGSVLITDNITLNEWVHVAVVWNDTSNYVFINNELNVSWGTTGTFGTFTSAYIGRNTAGSSFTDVIIDEFRISNKDRGQAEFGPQYSYINVTPASPQTYPIENITFNITWVNGTEGPIDSAWLYANFTGTFQDYFMANITEVPWNYTFNLTDPAAGYYAYRFHANDTGSLTNETAWYYYTVNQNTSVELNLSLNGTQENMTATYLQTSNATVWTNITGVTPELYRNGTLVSNPDINELAYGDYVYTAYLDQNYTANNVTWYLTINKADSGLVMTANPGWTVERNIEVNISCSANLNVTLQRDGGIVSNPYTAKLPYGIYNFTCTNADTYNYTPSSAMNYLNIISGGFGCTNNMTFAFQKTVPSPDNLTTLNFTTLISSGLVKADLSDTYINQSTYNITDVWKNATNGYYIIVNTTNTTNFIVEFGSYLGNESYSGHDLGENTTGMTDYEEQNAYYVLTFIDEILGITQLTPSSNVSVTFLCSLGTSTFAVNDTQVMIPTFDSKLDELKSTVSYPSDQYMRSYVIDSAVEYMNIYLADAYEHTVLQIPIYMLDYSYFDSRISIYKTDVGSIYIITDGYFDAERKFVTYLVKDEKYFIRIERDSETRDVGFLIPATATAQYLSISVIPLRPDISLISDNLQLAAEVNETAETLVIQYFDRLNQTSSVRIRAYEDVNQTAFFDTTYPGANNLTITINAINVSRRFSIIFTVSHQRYGNSPVELTIGAGVFGSLIDLGVASWLYPVFGFMVMLFTSFVIVPKIRFAGLIFLAIIFGVLCFMQWFQFAVGVLILIILFIVISIVYELKRGGMT